MNSKSSLPDFYLIGAAKSGTMSLYNYLGQHPQILMHPVNENCFMGLDGADFAQNFQGPVDRHYLDSHCITDLNIYKQGFATAQPHQLLGDASPLYLYSTHALERIAHYTPTAKFVAILRHPADRAFSNWAHFRRGGIEPLADFSDALSAETQRIQEGWGPWPFWHYKQMGFYAQQLTRYYEMFSAENIYICLHKDLKENPLQLVQKIAAFLEVDVTFEADLSVQHNIGGTPRNRQMQHLLTRPNPLKAVAKRLLPTNLKVRLRDGLQRVNSVRPAFDVALRQTLINDYLSDICELESLIQRDLSHWREM